ncbi:CaiB/BaiF CoA transferase family protein [Thermaurantiacus tibetensis]|uniref:CaiB/BaiF CoA transferase family protein n=1 Tax=Thermaurantiacus tibetensis TaxID=2759035 RepID=UPI0018904A0D|nr:CoA transferase [Thermaurantiacus tibetensis]
MATPGTRPLEGILVVDLTRVLAGPYATMLLADLGARVIKVEAPGTGDDARAFPPFVDGESAYFASINRGKESIALDLKAAADRAVFEALLARADVLAENFRPGALARLGYGFDALHARFPRLIVASTSGFGQTGPEAARPAYDVIVQAMGGIMSVTGHPGQPPVRVGTSLGDITAGLFTVVGIEAALLLRERTGRGTHVDVAMFDCQLAILENAIARLQVTGADPAPLGSRHPSITPFQAFMTADAPIVVAAGNDALFRAMAEALGVAELADDPRFATNAARTANQAALEALLEARFKTAPAVHWLDLLGRAGVPAGPVNRISEALAMEQVAARTMLVETALASGRPLKVAGNPVKLAGVPDPATRPPAPALDADRARLLAELGLAASPSR